MKPFKAEYDSARRATFEVDRAGIDISKAAERELVFSH
jgi:hypothetical protein